MSWTVQWSDTAIKQLKKLPKKDQTRILNKTEEVEADPFRFIGRLEGEPFFRYRVGNYRIILSIENQQLLLHILKVKKRPRAY